MKYEQSKLYIKKFYRLYDHMTEKTCNPMLTLSMNSIHPKSRNKTQLAKSSQLHSHLGLLNSNFGIGTEPVDDQVPSHPDFNLHQFQFPQLDLHGNVCLQIQGNAGLLFLRLEHREHLAGELSAGPGERYVQVSGILVALIEYRQGARAELRAGV